MADNSDGAKRSWWQAALGFLLDTAFRAGWGRRILVAVAILFVVLALAVLSCRNDYTEDPSLLVPREAVLYLEAKKVDLLFNEVASWPLWDAKRRFDGEDIWNNKLLGDAAGLLGEKVGGLGTRLPMNWLTKSKRAAWCQQEGAKASQEIWALYLEIQSPASLLAEMAVEPGLGLETIREPERNQDRGIFALTGSGEGKIYFGILGPWLIISSSDSLPAYAIDSLKKPAYSLGRSGILPDWQRNRDLRGMYDPSRVSLFSLPWSTETLRGWIASGARRSFSASVDNLGGMELYLGDRVISDAVPSGKLWTVLRFILIVLGCAGLLIVLAVFLIMINWAGWLKLLAIKAGITPAAEPAPVAPSQAFMEDAGIKTEKPMAAEPALPAPVPEEMTEEPAQVVENDAAAVTESATENAVPEPEPPAQPSAAADASSAISPSGGVSDTQVEQPKISEESSRNPWSTPWQDTND